MTILLSKSDSEELISVTVVSAKLSLFSSELDEYEFDVPIDTHKPRISESLGTCLLMEAAILTFVTRKATSLCCQLAIVSGKVQ